LVVAPGVDVPLQRQDQCHGVLGDRVRIDARRIGETNAPGTDQIGNVAVHAGADRLNELQPVGYREAALISAPQERRIAAVGLDVTRVEPLAGG
jgi:hypothetical protein